MRALGIDFGTSNTVAMLAGPGAQRRPLLLEGASTMPSAVYLDPRGGLLVGRDAQRQARTDPSRFEPTPKRRVDDGTVLLGGVGLPVAQVFAAVLGRVAAEAARQLGGAPAEVRLTHPARWGGRRRGLLVEAAARAGLRDPRLVAEPVAAASYFTAILGATMPVGRSLAIYDLGGGTFDATVVVRTPAGFDVLAEDGLPDVGGVDFDHAIVEHLGRAHAGADPEAWARLVTPVDGTRRARQLLYDEVRAAKEMLSRTDAVDVAVPLLEIDAHLTQTRFEDLIRGQVRRTVRCLARTIAGAGLAAPELAGIFLVGGSSRIPLVAQLIHDELLVAATVLEQPELVVAEGVLCLESPGPPGPVAVRPGAVAPGAGPAWPGRGPVSPAPMPGAPGGVPGSAPQAVTPVPGSVAAMASVPVPGPGARGGPAAPDQIRLAMILVLILVVALSAVLVALIVA
jgi:molecular chaperone DnaK (HSP70)